MKVFCTVTLFGVAMAGCAVEGAPVETSEAQASSATAKMPPEAVKAMKDAESINLTPIFYACPRYLTFEPMGMDENGNDTPAWFGPIAALYDANKPSMGTAAGTIKQAICGTTQNADPLMSVRQNLPSGYSSCTTSAVGTVPAWLVCT